MTFFDCEFFYISYVAIGGDHHVPGVIGITVNYDKTAFAAVDNDGFFLRIRITLRIITEKTGSVFFSPDKFDPPWRPQGSI
jgi:hypothetical protein